MLTVGERDVEQRRSLGARRSGPAPTRIVKYIANSAAKNISSRDSHTMVPTATMFGPVRACAGCAGGSRAPERLRSPRAAFWQARARRSDPRPPVRHAAVSQRVRRTIAARRSDPRHAARVRARPTTADGPAERVTGPRLQRRPRAPASRSAGRSGAAPRRTCRCVEFVECATEPAVIARDGRRRHRPGDPRRRGRPGRRHGHLPPAQGRDLPLPAGAGAHRPAATTRWLATWSRADAAVVAPARPGRLLAAAVAAACSAPAAVSRLSPTRLVADADRARRRSWPRAADGAAARRGTSRRRHRLGDGRDHVRRGHAGPDRRASSWRCGPRARPPTRSPGWSARMLEHAHRIEVPGPAVDVVGTGGDRAHTVNISTMAAIVVAGTGRPVVKHGNRAASSACGAADVLEALGRRARPDAGRRWPRSPSEVGHRVLLRPGVPPGAAARRRSPRRELGVPTVFNFLGPLTNPAQPAAAGRRRAPTRGWPASMAEVFAAPRRGGAGVPRRRRARRAAPRPRPRLCGGSARAR